MAGFWEARSTISKTCSTGWTNDRNIDETAPSSSNARSPHPPEKLWRALTQPHLMEEWLMKNDFKPIMGHRFNLRGEWGGVLDCEVLAVEPGKTLAYSWDFAHEDPAYNLKSVVTFTLTPSGAGHASARRAGRFPPRPEAGLRRRPRRLEVVPRQAGRGPGADWTDAVIRNALTKEALA
jgi:uncharacterized protein YndB with AHSA1/START domain